METTRQPDVRAALRLVRELEDADGMAAVREVVLRELPRLVACDRLTWATGDGGFELALDLAGGDLDDGDLALLELLRPHLAGAVRRAAALDRLASLRLTRREVEVLGCVESGDANVVIARRLGMRPRTVEKHLEHAYDKLGVSSRTAALAQLREIAH